MGITCYSCFDSNPACAEKNRGDVVDCGSLDTICATLVKGDGISNLFLKYYFWI